MRLQSAAGHKLPSPSHFAPLNPSPKPTIFVCPRVADSGPSPSGSFVPMGVEGAWVAYVYALGMWPSWSKNWQRVAGRLSPVGHHQTLVLRKVSKHKGSLLQLVVGVDSLLATFSFLLKCSWEKTTQVFTFQKVGCQDPAPMSHVSWVTHSVALLPFRCSGELPMERCDR